MMSPKKSIKKSLEKPEDNWLISYADMMTLLTFLFIILYAMAAQRQGIMKVSAASVSTTANASASSSKGSVNSDYAYYYINKNNSSKSSSSKKVSNKTPSKIVSGKSSTSRSKSSTYSNAITKSSNSIDINSKGKPTYQEVEAFLQKNSLTRTVSIRQNETGIVFDIQAEILFAPGSSRLRPECYSTLSRIANYISTLQNDIIIAGHTDNQPIQGGQYQSSWELSCDRATKVLRYFTDSKGLNPERFQAVGYGSYRPIADNNTSVGRLVNRRVEIIVVKSN